MAIKFGELRKYLSRVARLSICFSDGNYDNYTMLSDIPDGKYDDYYVFGVGMVDVEFPLDVYSEPKEMPHRISINDGFFMGSALEIVLKKEARDIKRSNEKELLFGDLRDYLQCGKNFSVVTKEGWLEENFEWRDDIPEDYNDMYVYGIGIEDDLEAILKKIQLGLIDSCIFKMLRIVVSERPKEF